MDEKIEDQGMKSCIHLECVLHSLHLKLKTNNGLHSNTSRFSSPCRIPKDVQGDGKALPWQCLTMPGNAQAMPMALPQRSTLCQCHCNATARAAILAAGVLLYPPSFTHRNLAGVR